MNKHFSHFNFVWKYYNQLLSLSSFLLILGLSNIKCTDSPRYPTEIDMALDEAGGNKDELLKVIKHFSKEKVDSLKLDAAIFLIKNMAYHQSTYSENDFINTFEKLGEAKSADNKVRELIQQEFENFDLDKTERIPDSKFISSLFLINSINQAFEAWHTYPWCKNMSYEDFKTYVLPYRMSEEPLEEYRHKFRQKYSWVLDSIKNPNDMSEAFTLIYNSFYSEFKTTGAWKYRILTKYSEFLAAKTGLCGDAANTLGMALRSMGIKCSFDYSVQWGNQAPNKHSWISFPADGTQSQIIEKEKILKVPDHVHSGKFDIEEPANRFVENNISVEFYKRGTKIRRWIFEINHNSLVLNESKIQPIKKLNDVHNVDITEQYIKTSDIDIKLEILFPNNSHVYLGVFNGIDYNIVDVAIIRDSIASFTNVGLNNVYFPLVYQDLEFKSVSQPFVLKEDGKREFFIPTSKNQSLKLVRKYPVLGYTLNNANFLFHGRFQGANKADFSDAKDLFRISQTYLAPTVITINNPQRFRLVRFVPDSSRKLSIAEISYHSIAKGKEEVLIGTLITNGEQNAEELAKISDNDFSTIFHKEKNSWVGIDLGEGKTTRVNKIKFCPRTDTNFIIPGNEYQLYYWDHKWTLLQTKTAINYNISFENVPYGALLWLHCTNGGREERPFTYTNEKQIWF